MFSCTTAQHIYCTNCTVCNWTVLTVITQAAATCSAAQQHCTFTVQILYNLDRLQLNCTYSNYTQAAATCSAAQQHCTFTVQILYNLDRLQMNCTYSNYTQAAATCSAAQQHCTFTVQIVYNLDRLQMNCTYSNYTSCRYMFSCTTAHKLSSWCLLRCSAVILHLHK